ncbi:hypothetical protein NESM_000347200 [Novymonas esmeraldas]|uniref:BAR domain-containing protein n=1 Tax=Novymonas esmeraldas TaxID=1808958 RepID=A0AAW0EMD4_9TRYP
MPTDTPSDDQAALIKKLKHACSSYDTASKKYLTAVKELDGAMEAIAIAIRELSQGESNDVVRSRADSLCTAVDRHMASSSVGVSGQSKSRRVSEVAPSNGATYSFVTYMNDFTREISAAIEELKENIKVTEKAKTKHDELVSKYAKKRADVNEMETKLAKKNQGIANNPKFATKVAERDALKTQVEADDERFRATYNVMLQKRSQTLQRVVNGLQTYSVKYYTNLSRTMQS